MELSVAPPRNSCLPQDTYRGQFPRGRNMSGWFLDEKARLAGNSREGM